MQPIPPPVHLQHVLFYRQERGKHPLPCVVAPYNEWVEVLAGGRGWVRDGREWREVGAGDLLWHSPGDGTIARSDFDNPYSSLSVYFNVRDAAGSGIRRFSRWNDIDEIHQLAYETCRFGWDESFDREALKDYLFGKLIFQVRVYERSLKNEQYPAPVALAIERIETGFAQPLTLKDLAKDSGWSPAYLHAEFLKHVKITPHQFLIQKRLRVAKQQIVVTHWPLKRIAVENGFGNLTAFGRAFKAFTGQTPSQFRSGRQ